MRKGLHIFVVVAGVALASVGGWYATSTLQRSVSVLPGLEGCYRLDGNARQIDCLSDEFETAATKAAGTRTGAARATAINGYVRTADRRAARDDRLGGLCHPAMHQLGQSEGRRAGKSGTPPKFPGGASQLCTAGFVHGLAEGYLTGTPDADVASVYPRLCADPAAKSGCTHGVGHALLKAHADEPSPRAVDGALKGCTTLPGEWPLDCYDGVYMELALRTRPNPVPVDEYTRACDASGDPDRQLSCWGYLQLSLTTNEIAPEKVPQYCAKAGTGPQFTCIEGYGRQLGVREVAACERAADRPALVQRCIEGAIGLQVGSGHVGRADAREACGTLDATELTTYCRGAVTRYSKGRAKVERT